MERGESAGAPSVAEAAIRPSPPSVLTRPTKKTNETPDVGRVHCAACSKNRIALADRPAWTARSLIGTARGGRGNSEQPRHRCPATSADNSVAQGAAD